MLQVSERLAPGWRHLGPLPGQPRPRGHRHPRPGHLNKDTVLYGTVQYCMLQYLDVVEAAGEGEEVCWDHDVRPAEVHYAAPRVPVVARPQLRAVQGRHLRSGCRY